MDIVNYLLQPKTAKIRCVAVNTENNYFKIISNLSRQWVSEGILLY